MKYIQAAVNAVKGKSVSALLAEPWLCKERPALTEFLTVTVLDDGRLREPSVLMICLTDEGVKLGLKDEDAGGWCWRIGGTLQKALDALEKALASGEPVFRPSGGRNGARKK